MILGLILWLASIALSVVAYLMYKPTRKEPEAPLAVFKLTAIKLGTPIPIIYGLAKIGGVVIDWGNWTVVAHKNRQTKKG